MSVTITTDIHCDGEGCDVWTRGTTGPRPGAHAARVAAQRAGWQITRKRDLCPACKREEAIHRLAMQS